MFKYILNRFMFLLFVYRTFCTLGHSQVWDASNVNLMGRLGIQYIPHLKVTG